MIDTWNSPPTKSMKTGQTFTIDNTPGLSWQKPLIFCQPKTPYEPHKRHLIKTIRIHNQMEWSVRTSQPKTTANHTLLSYVIPHFTVWPTGTGCLRPNEWNALISNWGPTPDHTLTAVLATGLDWSSFELLLKSLVFSWQPIDLLAQRVHSFLLHQMEHI